VEALLRNAVEFMSDLEPTEGYSLAPTSDPKTTDLSTAPLPTVLTGPDKITVSNSSAGQTVVQHVQLAISSQPDIHCIAHVETEAHHMSVRVKRDKTTLLLKVVETEKEGIKTCQSWDEVADILEGGIYLDPSDTADQDVEVTIYQK
jgi:hypothetical protein